MYNISEKVLTSILKRKFNSLVGKSCKRLEIIRDIKNVSFVSQVELLKDLIKELDYETMREIKESISSFSKGVTFDVKFERPISK